MPAKIIKKRTAQKIRKSVDQRNKQQAAGRKRLQPAKASDAIIADSLSTMRLKPKGGAVVYLNDEGDTSVKKIYSDLKAGYMHVSELLNLDAYPFKAIESLSMVTQLEWMIKKFKEIIPFGFDFEIVQVEYKDWHFVIFKEIDNNDQYDVIFVEDALANLKTSNPGLHNLFVEFLKILVNKTSVDAWWNSYADSFMEEEIGMYENDEEADPEYIQRLKDDVLIYKTGLPSKYQKMIHRAEYIDPLLLAKKLGKLRKHHALALILMQGCELLNEPYSLPDFGYSVNDMNERAGLRFENQSAIMWKASDEFFTVHEDYLNTEAGEGLFLPTIYKTVDKNMKASDFDWLKNGEDWPVRFYNLIDKVNKSLSKL